MPALAAFLSYYQPPTVAVTPCCLLYSVTPYVCPVTILERMVKCMVWLEKPSYFFWMEVMQNIWEAAAYTENRDRATSTVVEQGWQALFLASHFRKQNLVMRQFIIRSGFYIFTVDHLVEIVYNHQISFCMAFRSVWIPSKSSSSGSSVCTTSLCLSLPLLFSFSLAWLIYVVLFVLLTWPFASLEQLFMHQELPPCALGMLPQKFGHGDLHSTT